MGGMPQIGQFLKPVGTVKYQYTVRVMRVWPPGPNHLDWGIEYERWGLKDGQPFDDGHVVDKCYTELAPTAIPGVWRDPFDCCGNDRWRCCPLYYRAIDTNKHGQQDMFL